MSARARTRLTRNPLTAALLAALILPGLAMAQSTTTQQSGDEDEEETTQTTSSGQVNTTLDKMTVVGSRIKRAAVETASPVTVITREEIDLEGHQSVSDMLQTLTQGTTGSFTGDMAVSGFTPNAQVVNLRALGPGYTLVLINGRRPAQYPQPYNRDNNITNVRTIPTSIIERTEVMTGGASAIYGSDAVAGVVNMVTRKNFDGNQVRATIGTTEDGGGESANIEFSGGQTGNNWSILYALQYAENEPVFANERYMTADVRNNPYGLPVNPSLALAAWNVSSGRPIPLNHVVVYDQAACDRFGYTTVTTPARGTYCGSYTNSASRSLFNAQKFYSGYTYGTLDLSEDTQLFASLSYYTNKAKSSSGTEFWGTSGDRFTTRSNGAASTFFYEPNLGYFLQMQRIFQPFELGGEEAAATLYDEKTWTIEAGAQGVLGSFDWEASFSHGKYDYTADRPRLLAKAVHDYFLGPVQGYASGYPIHAIRMDNWLNPITPEIYQSFATRVINEGTTSSSTVNFTIAGDVMQLPAGSVGFAAVLEGNRQTTDLMSDWRTNQLLPPSENTIFNLTSSGETHGERDRYAAGAELRIPVFSWLTTQLAARYDKYNDISSVDDAITYNFGLEIRPFSNLLVRGSYATSFRAPDMQLIYSEGAASYSTLFDEYSCRSGTGLGQTAGPRTVQQCTTAPLNTIYQYSAQSRIAGNPGLEEEEGVSWGAGLVWDIIDNMSLSVDYYDIKLEGRSVSLSAATILQREADCRTGFKRDGSPADYSLDSSFCQQHLAMVSRLVAPGTAGDGRIENINTAYINAAYQRVTGIDSSFNYRWDAATLGKFALSLGWSLELSDEYQQNADVAIIDNRDLWDYNSRSRMRGSLSWNRNSWSAAVFGTRYGSVVNWAETARLQPWHLYNLNIGKKFGDNTQLTLQINNVLDNKYRLDPTYTGYPYFYNYHGSDILGRRYYLTLQHKF